MLITILTAFVLLMTTLMVVPNGRIYVAGETARQIVDTILVKPNAVTGILVFRILWLLLVGWVATAVSYTHLTLPTILRV